MINKFKIIHSVIFILLSFLSIFIYYNSYLLNDNQTQVLLLLIFVSLIGIPHGFFDFSIGKNIFKNTKKNWIMYFSFSYIFIILAYGSFWYFFPFLSLIFFLLISLYHFGYEDYNYYKNNKNFLNIQILIDGTIIIIAPIIFHFNEVSYFFSILIEKNIDHISFSYNEKIYFLLFSLFYFIFFKKQNLISKIESGVYFLNFVILPPLISFILYFCLLHSIRHFLESIFVLNHVPKNFSIKSFLILIVASSFIFSLLSIYLISNLYNQSLEVLVVKYIFIALACLTLPHIIFNLISLKKVV